jgi:teichoic acid transport system ATP-binding protein
LLRYLSPWAQRPSRDDFWALKDFNLELRRGEVVGLIGCNGSGKSTFLQLVAGLLEPSTGSLDISGAVAALLELGAGFNPDFTGIENVYLSGRIHGYSTEEMDRLFEPIVEFADIGDHLDQPVRTYSSGMYARLAFAVAIQVDPQILLIDEILSVGDIGFQAKCFRKLEEIRENGASILFVSHDLNSMQMLCDRLVLLDNGLKVEEGAPKDVAASYIQRLSRNTAGGRREKIQIGGEDGYRTVFRDIKVVNSRGEEIRHPVVGETYWIKYRVLFTGPVRKPIVTAQFKTLVGLVVSDLSSRFLGESVEDVAAGDELEVTFRWTCNFCPGPYRLGVGAAESTDGVPDPIGGSEALLVEVIAERASYGITHVEPSVEVKKITGGS